MIYDPIAKDQNAHQRPAFLLSMPGHTDGNVPASKINQYLLQFSDYDGSKHLQFCASTRIKSKSQSSSTIQ